MEEKELIKRLLKNEKTAQKYLYDKYSTLFYGICVRYSSNTDEACDILQEGFLKILTHINKFSGTGSFEGWMKRIIVNNAINSYHKNLKYRYHTDVSEIKDTIEDETSYIEDTNYSYEELLKLIQVLPEGYRTIFNLYAIEGYKHKEIAEMLKISENTSKSQYHRAKRILQDKLFELSKEKKHF
jgi:RNA polymerase sigma-70 factor (ECF subfamily)